MAPISVGANIPIPFCFALIFAVSVSSAFLTHPVKALRQDTGGILSLVFVCIHSSPHNTTARQAAACCCNGLQAFSLELMHALHPDSPEK